MLDYVGKILFLKNIDYKNENEFRICTLSSEEYDYINIKDCIVGIIAPMKRINPYSRKMLKEYCKPIDIDLIDISWDANSVSYRKYYNNTLYPGEY